MWPLLSFALRRRVTIVTFPIAVVLGFIGYNVEKAISNNYTPWNGPINQQRQDRLLENVDSASAKKNHSPLDVNLSPSLSS